MYQSLVLMLLLCTSVCLIDGLGGTGSNDYTYGTIGTSTLIADEIVSKPKTFMGTTTQTYTLTQAGTAKTIAYIKITDLKKHRGATATIQSGGVGSTTLVVQFTSAKGASIKSRIQVYGS